MSADVYDLLKIAAEELIAQNTELKSKLAEAREALEYIAYSGLSARHIEDYAKEFISKK
jgi:hypothetical protein